MSANEKVLNLNQPDVSVDELVAGIFSLFQKGNVYVPSANDSRIVPVQKMEIYNFPSAKTSLTHFLSSICQAMGVFARY